MNVFIDSLEFWKRSLEDFLGFPFVCIKIKIREITPICSAMGQSGHISTCLWSAAESERVSLTCPLCLNRHKNCFFILFILKLRGSNTERQCKSNNTFKLFLGQLEIQIIISTQQCIGIRCLKGVRGRKYFHQLSRS